MNIVTETVFDFSDLPEGADLDGWKTEPCPICGNRALPGLHRRRATYTHQAQLIKGVLYALSYCTSKKVQPRPSFPNY